MNDRIPLHVANCVLFHSQDTKPEKRLLALVVLPPEAAGDTASVQGMYEWDGRRWLGLDDGAPLVCEVFWWVSEADLVRPLELPGLLPEGVA
ncbi:MAG: hypothetical protein KDH15_21550 [Rhodocyclaceae bacterium]|nr:hypothetical protein [Rhodocyclaceae bacterium]